MYVLVLLREERPDQPAAEVDHEAFVDTLIARHAVLLGGPFPDPPRPGVTAAYLLRCADEAEAAALVAGDPLVASGAATPTLVPWDLVGIDLAAVDAALALPLQPPGPATVTAGDLRAAVAVVRSALETGVGLDWTQPAEGLTWDCRRTLDHCNDALALYATLLATRTSRPLPPARDGHATAPVAQLLVMLDATAAVLAEVVAAAPAGARAYHPAGRADAEGFAAMGCDELLVHGRDIAAGLGLPFSPPAELCGRVVRRLFPWAPEHDDPVALLWWANGRTALPTADRLGPDWYWHCAPLDEWDGTVARRHHPPHWR